MGRKTSIVWNHFTIPVLYPKKALCNYCRQLVCRGQSVLGTTSLMNHLKRCNEFKSIMLEIPKLPNEAAGTSGPEERMDIGNVAVSDVEIPVDEAGHEPHWKTGPAMENAAFHFPSNFDDSPSFVGRRSIYQNRDYQTNNRVSTLLYGDISSTSEPTEEPSSSSTHDNVSTGSGADDLFSYSSSRSTVDFMYGGLVLHTLYEQYKAGRYCDMHIIPQKIPVEVTISETGKVTKKTSNSDNGDTKISVHTSVLAGMSKKVSSLIEMGCNTIQLKKGGGKSVRGLMEIVYTGKLERIRSYTEKHLLEILEVARFLEVDYAVRYLMQEIPEGKGRTKTSMDKLLHDRMLSITNKPNQEITQSVHVEDNNNNAAVVHSHVDHSHKENTTISSVLPQQCSESLLNQMAVKRVQSETSLDTSKISIVRDEFDSADEAKKPKLDS